MKDYWKEAVTCAFEDHGVVASQDQIAAIAEDMMGASETRSEATGEAIFSANLRAAERDAVNKLKESIAYEKEKYPCPVCAGKRVPCFNGQTKPAYMECDVCDRTGLVHPSNRKIPHR